MVAFSNGRTELLLLDRAEQQAAEVSLEKQGPWRRQDVVMTLPAVLLKFTARGKAESIQSGRGLVPVLSENKGSIKSGHTEDLSREVIFFPSACQKNLVGLYCQGDLIN